MTLTLASLMKQMGYKKPGSSHLLIDIMLRIMQSGQRHGLVWML